MPEGLLYFFVFIFGLIIGSFLNVVILRYNTGFLKSRRSRCFSCNKLIRWFENIPVLSFIFLRGRCSECRSKISWQYPLAEFFTGILFLAVFLKLEPILDDSLIVFIVSYLFIILSSCLLILIFVYDLRHKIIPDGFAYAFAGFSLAFLVFQAGIPDIFFPPHLFDLLAGPILFLPFFALWYFSRGMWIGLGDGKLALGIGWFLGLASGASAIILAFWIGAAVSLALLAVDRLGLFRNQKGLTMKSEIPFGPFLIFATLLTFFFDINILFISSPFS